MNEALQEFGRYLDERGQSFELVVIGGAALLAMGVIQRATTDVDCLDPDLPAAIQVAAVEFAKGYQGAGAPLRTDWLNNGPRQLKDDLPAGWRERVHLLHRSAGLTVYTLGRSDLLLTKLFAYCDRFQDEGDCLALAPSADELQDSYSWLKERDGHPGWPEHVRISLLALAEKIGYECRL